MDGVSKLVCVNPASIRDYEAGGGVFKLGVLPKDIHMSLVQAGSNMKMEDLWKAVKYGVKGHSGLVFEDGTEVPFEAETDGKKRVVVGEKTLEVYLHSRLIGELANELILKGSGPKVRERLAEAQRESEAT